MNYLKRILRIIPAIIVLQTLFFKFTAHPESVALFTKLGMEPHGRIGTGILELIAAICILIPATSVYGAMLIVGLMCGAVYFHMTVLGYDQLFALAVVALVCSAVTIYLQFAQIKALIRRFYS